MFDNSDDEQVQQEPAPFTDSNAASSSGRTLLFGSGPPCRHGCPLAKWPTISEDKRNLLLYLYRQRVDCLYKILHWPTVLGDISPSRSEAQERSKPTPIRALEHSIYFMSLCSLTDDEACSLGLGDRAALVEQYRDATERALSEAGLLLQPNVVLLQAYVIYLVEFSCLCLHLDADAELTLKRRLHIGRFTIQQHGGLF
jgi:hypothetical protein